MIVNCRVRSRIARDPFANKPEPGQLAVERTMHPCPCCQTPIDWFSVTCLSCRRKMDAAMDELMRQLLNENGERG